MQDQEGEFLDLLYDAAVEPGLWEPAMERFADLTGGTSAWLARLDVANGLGSGVIVRIDPTMPALYEQYYGAINPFAVAPDPAAYMRAWTPKVMTEDECVDPGDLLRGEYFNDFMRPQDMRSVMIVRLSAKGQETCALTITRPEHKGQFEAEDVAVARRLHGHLRRAFALTEIFEAGGLKQDEADAALDAATHGLIILDDSGAVRRMNGAAETMLAGSFGLRIAQGRLIAVAAASAQRLEALIAHATATDAQVRRAGDMVLPVAGKRSPLLVSVAPVANDRHAVFGHRPGAMVCIRDPDAATSVSAEQLRRVFGLTGAEARVALAIMDGATAREIAERLGVSFHTVRHQMQSVLEKAGVARQAELVALLTRIGSLG